MYQNYLLCSTYFMKISLAENSLLVTPRCNPSGGRSLCTLDGRQTHGLRGITHHEEGDHRDGAAAAAGTLKALRQSLNQPMPRMNSGPIMPPPTLWSHVPDRDDFARSFCDHQCTMVRPQGGQPMP